MALVVGLDIGTTKVCCIAADVQADGSINIIGCGVSPCKGLQRGIVVDIEQTIASIENAVQETQAMAGQPIEAVYVGVTGDHIQSLNRKVDVSITRANREITDYDLDRLLERAKQIALPPDRELLHVIPRHYTVDGQKGVLHPVGMSGSVLEMDVHVVTAGTTFLQNIRQCVKRAGLQIEHLVLEPLASGIAVLSQEERDVGVALVDIGGGTSDLAIFYEGGIFHSGVVSLGGTHVTRDVYVLFQTSAPEEAERIKREAGVVVPEVVPETEVVQYKEMGSLAERKIPRRLLAQVIQARVREILELVRDEIERSDRAKLLTAGVVLTGGGACLPGTVDLAREVFGAMPVRIGTPYRTLGGMAQKVRQPLYATAIGLVLYGAEHVAIDEDAGETSFFSQWLNWFKKWLPKRER
ncbi:MAG: cell division protein FtsA [Fimbriimonadia bacterium]|nr:cell division protein FtsA [Fimbriimonadia bacterium]